MTTPLDPDDDLPSFTTKAGGPLSDAQKEISDKALLYAEAGPPAGVTSPATDEATRPAPPSTPRAKPRATSWPACMNSPEGECQSSTSRAAPTAPSNAHCAVPAPSAISPAPPKSCSASNPERGHPE